MKKIGVLMSGCGFMDGGEVHETTLTLLALDREDVEIICIAPDKTQADVVNHAAAQPMPEKRNVLIESARIARSKPLDIKDVKASDMDALILPGGFGAAKNLCDFAFKGESCSVEPEVERLINEVHDTGKPLGAICIAPVVLARVLGKRKKVKLTIGSDAGTAEKIEIMGARHENCDVTKACVDSDNKIVTTPAYMLAQRINEVFLGIEDLVKNLVKMV